MVREPVERAYSAHRHELNRGFETEEFEAAIDLEEQRTAGEVERMIADPSYASFDHRHHSYLARSRYSEQIDRLIDELGRDRVYVVDADVFFADPVGEFERLRAWLGLPSWRPAKVEQWNAQPAHADVTGAARPPRALLRAVRRPAGRADGARAELARARESAQD